MGVFKVKLLEENYDSEAKLEFPGGWEDAKWKTFCGGVWIYFSETTQSITYNIL